MIMRTAPNPTPDPDAYDFEYICRCFGLMPIDPDRLAINLAVVVCLQKIDPVGIMEFTLPEGKKFKLARGEMAELERRLKEREATVARLRGEQIEREAKLQIDAQMEAANNAITAAQIQGALTKRRPQ